jgi:hypothetical protein
MFPAGAHSATSWESFAGWMRSRFFARNVTLGLRLLFHENVITGLLRGFSANSVQFAELGGKASYAILPLEKLRRLRQHRHSGMYKLHDRWGQAQEGSDPGDMARRLRRLYKYHWRCAMKHSMICILVPTMSMLLFCGPALAQKGGAPASAGAPAQGAQQGAPQGTQGNAPGYNPNSNPLPNPNSNPNPDPNSTPNPDVANGPNGSNNPNSTAANPNTLANPNALANPNTPVNQNLQAVPQGAGNQIPAQAGAATAAGAGTNAAVNPANPQASFAASPVAISRLFTTLDPNNKGYLSEANVSSNPYLAKNFQTCDTNHDGRLTQAEVSMCMQSMSAGEQ